MRNTISSKIRTGYWDKLNLKPHKHTTGTEQNYKLKVHKGSESTNVVQTAFLMQGTLTRSECTWYKEDIATVSLTCTLASVDKTALLVHIILLRNTIFLWSAIRAPIDQPISRESSAISNLVDERSAHLGVRSLTVATQLHSGLN